MLTNPALPGLVKIGQTANSAEKRANGATRTLKKAVSLTHECNLEAEESAARALLTELGKA